MCRLYGNGIYENPDPALRAAHDCRQCYGLYPGLGLGNAQHPVHDELRRLRAGLVELPSGDKGHLSLILGSGYGVAKTCPNKEAALKVIGSLLGAVVMLSLTSGMNLLGIGIAYQYVVRGLVLVLAVIFDVATRRKSK